MLLADYGNYVMEDGRLAVLSFSDENAGFLPDGSFDMEVFEDSQTVVVVPANTPARSAWKAAYRLLRTLARQQGGVNFSSGYEGPRCMGLDFI
jgi:hypothetical protein